MTISARRMRLFREGWRLGLEVQARRRMGPRHLDGLPYVVLCGFLRAQRPPADRRPPRR